MQQIYVYIYSESVGEISKPNEREWLQINTERNEMRTGVADKREDKETEMRSSRVVLPRVCGSTSAEPNYVYNHVQL